VTLFTIIKVWNYNNEQKVVYISYGVFPVIKGNEIMSFTEKQMNHHVKWIKTQLERYIDHFILTCSLDLMKNTSM
jgi:hypothetical protein